MVYCILYGHTTVCTKFFKLQFLNHPNMLKHPDKFL